MGFFSRIVPEEVMKRVQVIADTDKAVLQKQWTDLKLILVSAKHKKENS